MLDLKIITIDKLREPAIKALADEYRKRLRPFARLDIIELSSESFLESGASQAKEKEGARIIEALSRFPGAFTIALDERGAEYDSSGLAAYLEKQNGPIILVIGGSLGLSEKVLACCQAKLALSKLTFTHEMARLFLLEQLYRATTIIKGKKYHH